MWVQVVKFHAVPAGGAWWHQLALLFTFMRQNLDQCNWEQMWRFVEVAAALIHHRRPAASADQPPDLSEGADRVLGAGEGGPSADQ